MSAFEAPILDAQSRQNEGSLREESGKTPETEDVSTGYEKAALLAQAAAIGADAAAGLRSSGWKNDWILVLQGLCTLTEKEAASGDPAPVFRWERICEEIAATVGLPDAQWWSGRTEEARKKFSNAWKVLEERLPDVEQNLLSRTVMARVTGIVRPYVTSNHAGSNAKGYGLVVASIALPPNASNDLPTLVDRREMKVSSDAEIDYLEEIEVYPIPGWNKPFKLSLAGWRAALVGVPLFLAVVIGLLLVCYLIALGVSDLPARTIFKGTISTAILVVFVGWLSYPLYRLFRDRIVRAPSILELTLPLGHVLVLRREGDERVLRMVRYTATCPVCNADITIETGRRVHRGRLVGECSRNPVEHVYSFDFVTGKGRRL